jgi:hypothetical protein
VVLQANEPTILVEQVTEAVHEVAGVRFTTPAAASSRSSTTNCWPPSWSRAAA